MGGTNKWIRGTITDSENMGALWAPPGIDAKSGVTGQIGCEKLFKVGRTLFEFQLNFLSKV